jgi:hypothetical protein
LFAFALVAPAEPPFGGAGLRYPWREGACTPLDDQLHLLLDWAIHRNSRRGYQVLVVHVGNDATMWRGPMLTWMNFLTGSVHNIRRLTASMLGSLRRARLSLKMTPIAVVEVAAGYRFTQAR